MDMVVASRGDEVVMVEGAAVGIPEEDVLTAFRCAHDVNVVINDLIGELVAECGKPNRTWDPFVRTEEALKRIEPAYRERLTETMRLSGKTERSQSTSALRNEAVEEFTSVDDENALTVNDVHAAFDELESSVLREVVAREGRRLDGRALDEIRDIRCQVAVLPRTHGSAVFTRGETQALAITTLGTVQDEQRVLDALVEEPAKKFMLHYNFPPFSVGEVRPVRGPGRRDIGHGELAERALRSVLPDEEGFPYTIRIVADILESNGSSSMASVCGGTLSLMDAGVPIKYPVAGIAMGLVKCDGAAHVLTDIAGAEDHYGDMDLKVAGTQHGVTAVQMDVKVLGVEIETLRAAFQQAREARMEILRMMLQALGAPRSEVSRYAPVLVQVHIDPDLIGKLIGPGGKTIKSLEETYSCKIEVEDDGSVTVSSEKGGGAQQAAHYISQLGKKAQVGEVYDGVVTDVKDFGAIVELFPGSDGLCHISQLDDGFVKNVTDICKVGDRIKVKVISVEDNRVRLSRKAAMQDESSS
jgi:polyribonucleotide nucleotidyltransferase